MSVRDVFENIGVGILIVAISFGIAFGFAWLVNTSQDRYQREARDQCASIAKVSGVSEYTIGSDYSCILVKDGKIVTVKDW